MSDAVTPMSERVAEEVRVLLARRRLSASELARRINQTQRYLSRRLSCEVAFDVNDLELIANALDVEIADLLPAPARRDLGSGGEHMNIASSADAAPAPAPAGRPRSFARMHQPAAERPTPIVDDHTEINRTAEHISAASIIHHTPSSEDQHRHANRKRRPVWMCDGVPT